MYHANCTCNSHSCIPYLCLFHHISPKCKKVSSNCDNLDVPSCWNLRNVVVWSTQHPRPAWQHFRRTFPVFHSCCVWWTILHRTFWCRDKFPDFVEFQRWFMFLGVHLWRRAFTFSLRPGGSALRNALCKAITTWKFSRTDTDAWRGAWSWRTVQVWRWIGSGWHREKLFILI